MPEDKKKVSIEISCRSLVFQSNIPENKSWRTCLKFIGKSDQKTA